MGIYEASVLSKFSKSVDFVSVSVFQTCFCLCLTESFYTLLSFLQPVFSSYGASGFVCSAGVFQGLWLWSLTLNSLYVC